MTSSKTSPVNVSPMDEYNQKLVENLHPPNWQNPQPQPCYNLVVIGGGTAGLVTAAGAGLFGAKVALIEQHLLGGDCTNVGCVPSKAIIHSSRIAATINQFHPDKMKNSEQTQMNFSEVMERMRKLRSQISHHDSAQRFKAEFCVDIFFGKAKFLNHKTIGIAGQELKFKKAVIATGSRPFIPSIKGLEEVEYLTNETVFSLTQLPSRIAIVGGGYIGCELAQAFQRLGAKVTILQRGERVLKNSDPEASETIQQVFADEKINLVLNAEVQQVSQQNQNKIIQYNVTGIQNTITVDEIIIATGRSPNIQGLNLEAVQVKSDPIKGIIINDYLQTSNPNIYAVGDVCLNWKFTHAADAAARIVVQNSLFSIAGIGRKKLSRLVIPACIYTDPEVAQVGITESEIQQNPEKVESLYLSLEEIDRAILEEKTKGFIKIHVRRGTDNILGATIVTSHAGELINQITLAMVGNLGLKTIANTIYPYPTQSEIIRKTADNYNLKWVKNWIKQLTQFWLNLKL